MQIQNLKFTTERLEKTNKINSFLKSQNVVIKYFMETSSRFQKMFISISASVKIFMEPGTVSGTNDTNTPVKISCTSSRLHKWLYNVTQVSNMSRRPLSGNPIGCSPIEIMFSGNLRGWQLVIPSVILSRNKQVISNWYVKVIVIVRGILRT